MPNEVPSVLTFNILTMGCKVNTYDTSLLEKQLLGAGMIPDSQSAKVQIVNSCAVTESSTLEAQKHIRKLKGLFPDSIVVVTGCAAQVDSTRLKEVTGADLIIANSHKGQFQDIIRDHMAGRNSERVFHSNIFQKTDLDEGGGIESSRTRAFLKIQDGCNSFCSFCIIPFARGKSRSVGKTHLVQRVRDLHAQGFQEVVLTGVHCGDYSDESRGDFSSLVEIVLKETEIPRVRLSSLEPIEVVPRLWRLFAENKRLCPHFHVSLQSCNTRVLREMKRKYGQGEIREFFETFQKVMPHGFIGMDIIAGFPGETDEEFTDTYDFLASQPWTRLHVFPYSSRPGTLASKKPGHLKEHVIHLRARQLRALSLERQRLMAERQRGLMKDVLILEKPTHGAHGLSRDYWPVQIESFEGVGKCDGGDRSDYTRFKNREVQVEITGSLPLKNSEAILTGRVAQSC